MRVKLKDVVSIKHGFAFPGEFITEVDNGCVLVTPGNFAIGGGFQEEKCKFFSGNIPPEYVLKPRDLIVTMTDLSKNIDTLGFGALVPDLTDRVYLHNQRIGLVEVDNSKVIKDYLLRVLQTREYQRTIAGSSSGSTVHHTSPAKIENYSFELPCLFVQKRIANILSAYDDLIENNRKQIKLLEEAAQRLYKEWFVDLKFPGHENTPIHDGVPEGWRLGSTGDVVGSIESGSRPKGGINKNENNGIPSIGAENVIGLGQYNFDAEKLIPTDYYNSMNRGILLDKDIMVYKDGAYTGRVSFAQDGFPHSIAAVNEHVFLVRCEDIHAQYWLLFTLLQKNYFEMMQALSANSAQPGINRNEFLGLSVLLPSEALLKKFGLAVEPMVKKLFLLANQNKYLREARARLLPKLMSGELEV